MADLRKLTPVHEMFKAAATANGECPPSWTPCPRCGSARIAVLENPGVSRRFVGTTMIVGGVVTGILLSITIVGLLLGVWSVVVGVALMQGGSTCKDCHLNWSADDVKRWRCQQASKFL